MARGMPLDAKPPPQQGAIDLGAMKTTKAQRDQVRMQLLQQNGLICQCGERIRDEGITFFLMREDMVETPQGPQPGIHFATVVLHSAMCPLVAQVGADAFAVRDLPATRWLDEDPATDITDAQVVEDIDITDDDDDDEDADKGE